MIPNSRAAYNRSFSEDKYRAFLHTINTTFSLPVKFRIAESPVLVSSDFRKKLLTAADDIIEFICQPDYKTISKGAVPPDQNVPNEDGHTQFLALDFAVCKNTEGELVPQLIELQGFPSLYAFEDILAEQYKAHFELPSNYSHLFGNYTSETYRQRLGKFLLGNHSPENVILLEIDPYNQNTAIDFVVTECLYGISPVCISEIMREGKQLFYEKNNRKIPIHRIYNRVIFDELLQRPDKVRQFSLLEDVDVEWVGHPNWFFRISKFIMPMLNSPYVPSCRLLSDYTEMPADLENYVLKPLFSFSGSGVKFHVTHEDIAAIPKQDYAHYMLQKKVVYEPFLVAADGGKVKAEIRLLFLWDAASEKPELIVNLARLSRGEMIGVKYNKDKTWVGGSVCFFEP